MNNGTYEFEMHNGNFTMTCSNGSARHQRYPPLISASMGKLSGLGLLRVLRGSNGALNVSLGFDTNQLERGIVTADNVTLKYPKLPMKEGAMNEFLQHYLSKLVPIVN